MKRWYVLQIFAGYEDAIKQDIERQVAQEGLEEYFGEVLIPSAKLKSMLDVAADKKEHQLFPGYLLVELELTPEVMRAVQSAPRVLRFLGGKNPIPISQKEIDRVVSQVHGEVSLASPKTDLAVGNEVEITEGPFAGFMGMIEKINLEAERLTVMVSIFGRMTPIELAFNQVKY